MNTTPRPAGYTDGWGELIRAHRMFLGLSQRSLSERLGMYEKSLSDIEVGRRDCPPGFLDSIVGIVNDFDRDVEKAIQVASAQIPKGETMLRIEVSSDPKSDWNRAVIGRAAVESGTIMPILVGE